MAVITTAMAGPLVSRTGQTAPTADSPSQTSSPASLPIDTLGLLYGEASER